MRKTICSCAASLILWGLAGTAGAAPFEPQDSKVILADTSTVPPDTKGKTLRKLGPATPKRTELKKEITLASTPVKFPSRSVLNGDFKIQQESSNVFAVKDKNFKPGCLEVTGAYETCDSTIFGKNTCLSATKIDLRNVNGSSVANWMVDANDGLSLSWSKSDNKRVEIDTRSNGVSTADPSSAIGTLYIDNPQVEAYVTLNDKQQYFSAIAPGMQFIVHYCTVKGSKIDCQGACVNY
jgi:hypothetical protein